MIQAQIFIDKDELHEQRKLYEFVMEFLLSRKVAGATAFEGLIGFGPDRLMQRPGRLFSFDEPPMMIVFIDENEKAKKVITELRKEFKGGLIITSQVEVW
jgi:PII-like signaling protein